MKYEIRCTTVKGFVAAFLALWAISAVVWIVAFKFPMNALLAPIAPIFYGGLLLFTGGNPVIGILCVAVTGIAGGLIFESIFRGPRTLVRVFAYVMLAVYWFLSYELLGGFGGG